MKKSLKSLLSLFIVTAVFLCCTPFSAITRLNLSLTASAAQLAVGDIVEFGTYPQTEVTDEELLEKLNSQTFAWVSYGYHVLNDNSEIAPGDFMRYADVTLDGKKYRAVTFDKYRPDDTSRAPIPADGNLSRTFQDENEYYPGNIYWFKFEPIKWRVLDPESNFLLSELVLDGQAINNFNLYERNSTDPGADEIGQINYGDPEKTFYSNNYAKGTIRNWLNIDFYNLAFTSAEQNKITVTTLDNSAYSIYPDEYSADRFHSETTNDKIFLLSYEDTVNPSYGFNADYGEYDPAREVTATDYAKAQGTWQNTRKNNQWAGNSMWILRTASIQSNYMNYVQDTGKLTWAGLSYGVETGIRPALKLSNMEVAVTWNIDGIKTIQLCEEGDPVSAPEVPEKEGHSFLCWSPALPETVPAEGFEATAVYLAESSEDIPEPTVEGVEAAIEGWYKAGVTIVAPSGYEISLSCGENTVWASEHSTASDQNHIKEIYLKSTETGIVYAKNADIYCDWRSPTGTLTIGNDDYTSFGEASFGNFYKSTNLAVTISAEDSQGSVNSGIAKTEYFVGDKSVTVTEADTYAESCGGWLAYSKPFSLESPGKYIVYAKITDNAGFETLIKSGGYVLYKDAQAISESVSYTYNTEESIKIYFTGGENTVKSVSLCSIDSSVIAPIPYNIGSDERGDYAEISSHTAADIAKAGEYLIIIDFNPCGEEYADTESNDSPEALTVPFSVKKCSCEISIDSDISKIYDGNSVSAPEFTVLGSGEITVEYKLSDADDSLYSAAAPKDAGKYTVRISAAESDKFEDGSAQANFEITARPVTVAADSKTKLFGESDPELTYTITEGSLIEGDTLGGSLERNGGESAGVYDITCGSLANANYDITFITSSLTILKPDTGSSEAVAAIGTKLESFDEDRVTIFWKDEINDLIDKINTLLADESLSGRDREMLTEYKAQAEQLTRIINDPAEYFSFKLLFLLLDLFTRLFRSIAGTFLC